MARAKSFIQLRGSLGDTTFKKVGKNNFAHEKMSIAPGRMKNHRDFITLRENGSQMGNASKSAKTIRDALVNVIHLCKDSKMSNRFNAELRKVVRQDSSRGAVGIGRIARAENMGILQGFDFNDKAKLRTTFNVSYNTAINRDTGEVKLSIASFKPASAIRAPRFAKQFRIMAQVAEIDFDPAVYFNSKYKTINAQFLDFMPLDNRPTEPLSMSFKITTGNVNTIFLVLGVDFSDDENPMYASRALIKEVNAGCIVGVDEGVTVP